MILDENGCLCIADMLASGEPAKQQEAEETLRAAKRDTGDILARAAELAQQRYQTSIQVLLTSGCMWQLFLSLPRFAYRAGWTVFVPASVVSLAGIVGLSALLIRNLQRARKRLYTIVGELARREPVRALCPLLDIWTPNTQYKGKKQSYGRGELEATLSAILATLPVSESLPLDSGQAVRLRNKLDTVGIHWSRRRISWDVSDVRADVLVTLIQFLARSPEALDRAVVERFATRPAVGTNRLLVQGAARDCLEAATRERNARQAAATITAPPLPNRTPTVPAQTTVISTAAAPVLQQVRKP